MTLDYLKTRKQFGVLIGRFSPETSPPDVHRSELCRSAFSCLPGSEYRSSEPHVL